MNTAWPLEIIEEEDLEEEKDCKGDRIKIQCYFYCKHGQEVNEFWSWLLGIRLPYSWQWWDELLITYFQVHNFLILP